MAIPHLTRDIMILVGVGQIGMAIARRIDRKSVV